jgi:DNA-binding transcriptional regulator YiaG
LNAFPSCHPFARYLTGRLLPTGLSGIKSQKTPDAGVIPIRILYSHENYVNSEMATGTKSEVDWKAVGRRIRELRGFETNQAQFARALAVSQGQLSKYEQGNSEIGAEVLLRLARKSGKTIEWLLTGKQ